MSTLDTLVRAASQERLDYADRTLSHRAVGRPARRHRRRLQLTEDRLVFWLPALSYLVVGLVLVFHYATYMGDEQSRLANADYIAFSADPHLAAIGFVWNPLTSLLQLPLVLLSPVIPAMTHHALAAIIVGAPFMAQAVRQLDRLIQDLGYRRAVRITAVVLFAANPMIAFYGSNGMSESLYLCFLITATRHLSLWLREGRTSSLVRTGMALGLGYLTRNETTMAAALAGGVVLAVSYAKTRDAKVALLDMGILAMPAALAFAVWSGISWVIVGTPFAQLDGQYGTTAALDALGHSLTFARAPRYVAGELLLLAPGLVVAALLALLLLVQRRSAALRVLAPLAVLGGPLAFSTFAALQGKTIGSLRYYVVAIPLALIVAMAAAAALRGRALRVAAVALSLVMAAAAIPSAGYAMSTFLRGPEEYVALHGIWDSSDSDHQEQQATEAALDATLNRLSQGTATVLMDNAETCLPGVVLRSPHPKQFVIPNDRVFKAALQNPYVYGVRYIVAAPSDLLGANDAVNLAYPSLYATGGGFAELVQQFNTPLCPQFRLYHVLRTPPGAVG